MAARPILHSCCPRDIQVNVMDIRNNKPLRLLGTALLVSLALATMIGGVMVVWGG